MLAVTYYMHASWVYYRHSVRIVSFAFVLYQFRYFIEFKKFNNFWCVSTKKYYSMRNIVKINSGFAFSLWMPLAGMVVLGWLRNGWHTLRWHACRSKIDVFLEKPTHKCTSRIHVAMPNGMGKSAESPPEKKPNFIGLKAKTTGTDLSKTRCANKINRRRAEGGGGNSQPGPDWHSIGKTGTITPIGGAPRTARCVPNVPFVFEECISCDQNEKWMWPLFGSSCGSSSFIVPAGHWLFGWMWQRAGDESRVYLI